MGVDSALAMGTGGYREAGLRRSRPSLRWSLDNAFGFDLHGTARAVGALVIGVTGGVEAVLSERTYAGHEPHPVSLDAARHTNVEPPAALQKRAVG
jgi:hypothetical protein